ncbi:prolyl oligopeptidase family serine peptidase [Corynebacterium sp. zg254]|uniref:Prolyl oligopeptidase family serine peptidase n=1 Tax=Corynebacterium zhongnanshanii TaxID=2768834 RepID=A0ABQ6VET9_9CORY|nr:MULTISPECIES: PHB depolymerase family esterase [Corynebacterium]KAB3522919.1 prolyl oligopeptidase family serine peptidase [Corynebacterium zhongnanshanii]MCR5914005.1 prolyl oligopeptidase family serine peptidase [Corynebacterium sp. zg254]
MHFPPSRGDVPRDDVNRRRRRTIAGVIGAVAAVALSAGVGAAVQKYTGWNQADWDHHISIQEPGMLPPLQQAVGVKESGPSAQDIPVQLRLVDNPRPLENLPEPGRISEVRINSAGLDRRYLVYVPENAQRTGADIADPLPLILTYHGYNESPQDISRYSGMERAGGIVVYPLGVKKSWAGAPYAKSTKEQDQWFTRDIIDQIASTYQVDNNRIFAAGMSNGGGFVYEMACDMPDMFAAVASVAGAYYTDTWSGCAGQQDGSSGGANPQDTQFPRNTSIPFLEIHGRQDDRIKYEGGHRYRTDYLAAPKATALYAQRSGCEAAPTTTAATPRVLRTQWTNCAEGNEIVHLAITDAGHVWPGEIQQLSGASALGDAPQDTTAVTATSEIIAFFTRHGLQKAQG